MSSPVGEVDATKYTFDPFYEQYYLKTNRLTIRKRNVLFAKYQAEGLDFKSAWRRVFQEVPKVYENPATGLPYASDD